MILGRIPEITPKFRISTDGVIELEGAGLQVFEKKKKEPSPDNQSTAA